MDPQVPANYSRFNSYGEWVVKVQSTVNRLLSPFIPRYLRTAVLDLRSVQVWKEAFTQESMEQEDIYEMLEYMGDRVCGAVFALYLLTKYGRELNTTSSMTLDNLYMTEVHQHRVAKDMGLGALLRIYLNESRDKGRLDWGIPNAHGTCLDPPFRVVADLYKSFFRALYLTSKQVGFASCYKMMDHMLVDVDMATQRARYERFKADLAGPQLVEFQESALQILRARKYRLRLLQVPQQQKV